MRAILQELSFYEYPRPMGRSNTIENDYDVLNTLHRAESCEKLNKIAMNHNIRGTYQTPNWIKIENAGRVKDYLFRVAHQKAAQIFSEFSNTMFHELLRDSRLVDLK